MVHRMDAVKFSHGSNNKHSRRKFKVKSELAGEDDTDSLEGSSLAKRPKLDFSIQDDYPMEPMSPGDYNPLVEPSPLGLKLKKTPSFLDLIQMRLGKERSASLGKTLPRREKDKDTHKKSSSAVDKLKASNFPATLLKIGSWEYKSRYEGDLVAKCYFAKHKLVWEVLDGGLKNKIEIQWSDIVAIKATCPPHGPETLDVVLGRQPLFFREINPQPRKHTLWQATSDFTGGQATVYRRHFLQCSEGLLGKHFEKLIQCDPRLNFLCQQPDVVLDNPYFQPKNSSMFGGPSESDNAVDLKTEIGTNVFDPRDTATISGPSVELNSQGTPPSSADVTIMQRLSGGRLEEVGNLKILDQIKLPGLHPSMSMSDLVSHIGQCITEQIDPSLPINEEQKNSILQDIAQYLMSDSQAALPVYEEKSIMSRVNSLCSLLQKDQISAVQTPLRVKSEDAYNILLPPSTCSSKYFSAPSGNSNMENNTNNPKTSGDEPNMIRCPAMSRKDSMGDLLLNLPRIASLPQFLFNFPDDSGK